MAENVIKRELDELMTTVQKGYKALSLFSDAQNARITSQQYNYILSGLYDEIFTSTIETILAQISKLYIRSNNGVSLYTLVGKVNNRDLEKAFYEVKTKVFESQEWTQYIKRWKSYNNNLVTKEPDYFLPTNYAKTLLDFAYKYIKESGKIIGITYGDKHMQTNSLSGLLDFINRT